MCGINGIFAYHYAANPIDRNELLRTRDHMAARGPDGRGEWISFDNRVGLAHRRLSIIDLSNTGAQPMRSPDGRLAVTFNGEIYNYRQLRTQLEARGRVFQSQSDTEVLLHLYVEKGEAMVHDLRGMFAFAVWDEERERIFLARDPYGIKPLYYADDGWTLRFASQVKALLAGDRISREPDPAGQVGFYLWGSVPEPFTTYRDIRTLPAGCSTIIDRIGVREPRRYCAIADAYRAAEAAPRQLFSRDDLEAEVREALLDSVHHHLVADVPVGAFLSAGIDSGALVGLMRDARARDIQTVTLSFEEFRGRHDDEAPLAEEVARAYGTQHTTRVVTENEFQADLPRILDAMDQPSIDGINTWFVSKAARELGLKVAISGVGGDELFGGYPSFRDIPRWVRWFAVPSRVPLLGRALRISGTTIGLDRFCKSPKALSSVEYGGGYSGAYLLRRGLFMPWELDQMLDREMVRAGLLRLKPLAAIDAQMLPRPRSSHAKIATLESALYMRNQLLRDADWASMAHSLEIRMPLVDSFLLRRIARLGDAIVGNVPKTLIARAPSKSLPNQITCRQKTGFSTPVAAWQQSVVPPKGYAGIQSLRTANCHWSRRWAYSLSAT